MTIDINKSIRAYITAAGGGRFISNVVTNLCKYSESCIKFLVSGAIYQANNGRRKLLQSKDVESVTHLAIGMASYVPLTVKAKKGSQQPANKTTGKKGRPAKQQHDFDENKEKELAEFTNLIRALLGDMIITDANGKEMSLQSAPIDLVPVNDIQKIFFKEIEYAVKALKEKKDSGITLTADKVPTEFKDKWMLTSGTVVVKEVERMSAHTFQQIGDAVKALNMASEILMQQCNNSAPRHLSPPPSRDSSPVRTTAVASSDDDEEPRGEIYIYRPRNISAGKRKSNTTPVTPVTKKPRKAPVNPRKAPMNPRKAPVTKPRKAPISNSQIATSSDSSCTESDDMSEPEMCMSSTKPSETSEGTSAQEHIPVSSEGHLNDFVPIQSCQNPEPIHVQEHIPVSSEGHLNDFVPIQSCQNPEPIHVQEHIPVSFEVLPETWTNEEERAAVQSLQSLLSDFPANQNQELNTPPQDQLE